MPRAHRHFLPGQVWHITHRCHKQEFLLKFARDRRLWIGWLYEARRRYGLSVLNYTVTSNHIHLLVHDTNKTAIPASLQLIAGRTAQAYRDILCEGATYELREPVGDYVFDSENIGIRPSKDRFEVQSNGKSNS